MIGFVRMILRGLFRLKAFGEGHLRTPGPVLLVPNHVSWLDWLFLGAVLEETGGLWCQAKWLITLVASVDHG